MNKRKKPVSVTPKAMQDLRDEFGYPIVEKVERWCSFSHRKKDLCGFIDILAVKGPNTLGVQVTTGDNHAARVAKIKESGLAPILLRAGWILEVWSYSKNSSGKWYRRQTEITLGDFPKEAIA